MSSLVEAVVTSDNLNFSHSGIYFHLYSYFARLFASDKRQNRWTDRAQILYGTSSDPREGFE